MNSCFVYRFRNCKHILISSVPFFVKWAHLSMHICYMYIHRWLHTFLFSYTAFKHVSVSASEDVSYTFNTSVMFHICMYCSLFNQSVGFIKKKKAAVNICVHSFAHMHK